jgi:hypothetical protein
MIASLASAAAAQPTRFAFAARAEGGGVAPAGQPVRRSDGVGDGADTASAQSTEGAAARSSGVSADSTSAAASPTSAAALTTQEERLLEQLRQTDRRVRAHEQAHMAAGAGLVRGGVSFSYETGPDEKRYAVGGEVSIDVSGGSSPQETLVKARQIRAAALAPADPSAQDQKVAAQAARMESEARAEIAAQQREAITAQAGTQFYRSVEQGASAGSLSVYA